MPALAPKRTVPAARHRTNKRAAACGGSAQDEWIGDEPVAGLRPTSLLDHGIGFAPY
jgi:hypothetical protein